jgi:hypothetical protein
MILCCGGEKSRHKRLEREALEDRVRPGSKMRVE